MEEPTYCLSFIADFLKFDFVFVLSEHFMEVCLSHSKHLQLYAAPDFRQNKQDEQVHNKL